MEQNKVRTYFLYAVGEIALVMIGILLALQVNNWNEYRKERTQEEKSLHALLKEFENSKTDFQRVIAQNDTIYQHIESIYNHTGNKWDGSLSRHESDSLMNRLLGGVTSDVSTSYLDELLNTGRIQIIQNEQLQNLLTNWNTELVDHKVETEARMRESLSFDAVPFVHKHYTLYIGRVKRNISTPSGFDFDYTRIYQMQKFENIVLMRMNRLLRSRGEYQTLIDYCDEVISLIKSELED
ncbi:MAG: hypothetical protein JXR11_08940 [Balneola sp.]